jgi:predicted ATPase/class 3 adenylate cyclase
MRYVFAGCTFDTERYAMSRQGHVVQLRPKVFQLLLYLLEHRERVLSKHELCEQVWPNQFISDATLESHMRSVRQAVGDSGQAQRVIQTLRGHGYRFVASVTEVSPASAAEPMPHTSLPPPAALSEPSATPAAEVTSAHLPRQPVLSSTRSPEEVVPAAERRQLTVLFCDLVESTALATRLELEDYHAVLQAYQSTCGEVVQRFDGYRAQLLGDALLVYFGWPQAHEDDAQRAVHTGLGMLEVIQTLNAQLQRDYRVRLAIRVGIHTGPVVLSEMGGGGRQERLALGVTPNIAARLQDLAAPNTVVISATTARLIEGYFLWQAQGEQALRGIAQPMAVYRVVQACAVSNRLDIAAPRGLTPFVGREAEVQLLLERWQDSRQGHGHMVLLGGEPGVGKSRLVQVVRAHLAREDVQYMALHCSPYAQNSMLYPVITYLQRVLDWQRGESSEAQLDRLERMLRPYGIPLEHGVPLLASLLAVSLQDRYTPLPLTPQQQRQQTLAVLIGWLLEATARQPVLFVWEDLHWADPTSLELLALFLEQLPTAPVLALLTCRPEFRPPWTWRSHMTQLMLERLSRPQVEQMVARLSGDTSLPPEIVRQIMEKADGVPLFVEELVKMVLESGLLQEEAQPAGLTAPRTALAIPTTLRDSLTARLDRLPAGRRVAPYAAALGRQFSYELLQAAWPNTEIVLHEGLTQLLDAELVYQRGVPPHRRYTFKHALIQEVAYQSLLRSTRQHYHGRIAQALVTQFPDLAASEPEVLAHHYTEAGMPQEAIEAWLRAGQRAVAQAAHQEAIVHLSRGLAMLADLPETPARMHLELVLRMTIAPALIATKSYASPEVHQTYSRALTLCQQLPTAPERFSILFGLYMFYCPQAEYKQAQALGQQLLDLAEQTHDPMMLTQAHHAYGITVHLLGNLPTARHHYEAALALYDMEQQRPLTVRSGLDTGVGCWSYLALLLWQQGYPAQARHASQQAIALAEALQHPFSLARALCLAAYLSHCLRDPQRTQQHAQAALDLSQAQGFPIWIAAANLIQAWGQVVQGQTALGVTQLRQEIESLQALGIRQGRSNHLALLVEAHLVTKQVAEGLAAISEALRFIDETVEYAYVAELYRLRGELLLCTDEAPHSEVEGCFQQALDIARRQQARMLELRAALSLGRLWRQQGRHAAAQRLVTDVYTWFTEGFDTPDVQDAEAFLHDSRANGC